LRVFNETIILRYTNEWCKNLLALLIHKEHSSFIDFNTEIQTKDYDFPN
jgi:hypothetical protein